MSTPAVPVIQDKNANQGSTPKAGDVLVSERSACADVYAISVVPGDARLIADRYDQAIDVARTIARHLKVDGWYTCDQTHYVAVATHRPR